MARPLKTGLDYFQHDVGMSVDEKIEALEAVHGNDGYAVYNKLLERIYKSYGKLDLSDDVQRLSIAKKCNVSIEKFELIITDSIRFKLFEKEPWESEKRLTSERIRTQIEVVEKERAGWRVKGEKENPEKEELSPEKTPVIPPIIPGDNPSYPERKVHKGEERRGEYRRGGAEQEEEENPFEAEGAPPACASPDVREELKTAGFHFPKNDLESIEGYLKKHNLDAGYIRYVLSRMAENAKEKPIKNRVTYFRKAILWEDWRSGYREWQESERRSEAAERIRRARASPPKVCPVCGKPLTMTDTAVACKPCGKLWEFDEQRLVWREEKLYNPREVQEVVF
jgi:hypothetical protein